MVYNFIDRANMEKEINSVSFSDAVNYVIKNKIEYKKISEFAVALKGVILLLCFAYFFITLDQMYRSMAGFSFVCLLLSPLLLFAYGFLTVQTQKDYLSFDFLKNKKIIKRNTPFSSKELFSIIKEKPYLKSKILSAVKDKDYNYITPLIITHFENNSNNEDTTINQIEKYYSSEEKKFFTAIKEEQLKVFDLLNERSNQGFCVEYKIDNGPLIKKYFKNDVSNIDFITKYLDKISLKEYKRKGSIVSIIEI